MLKQLKFEVLEYAPTLWYQNCSDRTGRRCMLRRSLLKQEVFKKIVYKAFSGGNCLGVSSCWMVWKLSTSHNLWCQFLVENYEFWSMELKNFFFISQEIWDLDSSWKWLHRFREDNKSSKEGCKGSVGFAVGNGKDNLPTDYKCNNVKGSLDNSTARVPWR